MRTVVKASARALPRLPARANQAPADARPALAASVVVIPATPVGAEGRPQAVAAAGSGTQRSAPARQAGTAVWAGRRAPVAGRVPVGPRPQRTARLGDRVAPATGGDLSAPGMRTVTRHPSGQHVPPLAGVGMPTTAAATAEGLRAAATGRGEARLSRGAATVGTMATTEDAAIAAPRDGARTEAAATTRRPAVGRAAPVARRPGRRGMYAARRAGRPGRRTRPGLAGPLAPAEASPRRAASPAATTAHRGSGRPSTKRAWTFRTV
jgi:hypothetical protein